MNIFEQATRQALRFETSKGMISTEDLWNLPLTGKSANLDDIAIGLNRELKAATDDMSYVRPITQNKRSDLQLKFDVVKHVIDVLVAERDAAADAAKKRATKQRILELIAEKQDGALKEKSLEELQAMANSL